MNRIKKFGLNFLAMNVLGIAIALFLKNGLGADSIGLLCDGLQKMFQISFGTASLLYNLLMILLALLFARNKLGMGTIVYAVFTGYFTDFYYSSMSGIELINNAFALRLCIFAFAQICLSLGFAILIQCDLGMSALDALLQRVEEKTFLSYRILKTIIDFSFVGIGIILGGTFGIGTILSIIMTGFMIDQITHGIVRMKKRNYYR